MNKKQIKVYHMELKADQEMELLRELEEEEQLPEEDFSDDCIGEL